MPVFRTARGAPSSIVALALAAQALMFAPQSANADECIRVKETAELLNQRHMQCLKERLMENYCFSCYQSAPDPCQKIQDEVDAYLAREQDPYTGSCPNPERLTAYNSDMFAPRVSAGIGALATEKNAEYLLSFSVSPMDGTPRAQGSHGEIGTSRIIRFDFTMKKDAGIWKLDRLKVYGIDADVFFDKHFGMSASMPRINYDKTRGQTDVDLTYKFLVSLTQVVSQAYYDKRHIFVGAGVRLNFRNFGVLNNEIQTNFQIPVGFDLAQDFFKGKVWFNAFVELALNPLRTRDRLVNAGAQVRYNLLTEYSRRDDYKDTVSYELDMGAGYDLNYQNERAVDYGPLPANTDVLSDKVIHRANAFLELAF